MKIFTKTVSEIGNKLMLRGWTITCAESCTGGGLAYNVTGCPGSSNWFTQSYVTYSNEAKSVLLKVKRETLAEYGAVSAQTVEEMARGAAHLAQAEVAVAISGIAGPGGGSAQKPVGTVWFGFYVDGEQQQYHRVFTGDRQAVQVSAIEFALETVLTHLE